MVTGMHFRHPAVLASMASSLDIVSGGRLEIGLGAGWYDLEADAYDSTSAPSTERMTRFEEGTEVIHLLLTEEHSNFDGRFFQLSNARNDPKPIQQPRPTDRDRRPGREANASTGRPVRDPTRDALFVEDEKDEWLRLRDVLWGHCQEVGRDPEEVSCSSHLSIGPEPDPAEVATRSAAMFDAGIDVVIFGFAATHDGSAVEAIAGALSDIG